MTLIPTNLDYTDRDFDAIQARLSTLLRQVFPWWTDFNRANFGNVLLGLFCHVGDVLCFLQDNQALDSRIATAKLRKNMLALCKLIGYTPATASAATVDETFSIPAALPGDVVFPAGTIVKTADVVSPAKFQLLAPLTIVAGLTEATGTVEHSLSWTEVFSSSGRPNQEFVLSRGPYLDGSVQVSTLGDGPFTQVLNFLDSGPTDKHFTATVDQAGKVTIRFGNGVNGKIPTGNITHSYKTGGGSAGNVAAGAILKVEGSFTDSLGNPAAVSVTNALASSGGEPRESMAQIRVRAPATVRVAGRSVAREDFEINALRVPGIARALMVTSDDVVGIDENTGRLYLIPSGGGTPSSAKKQEVLDMVTMTPADFLTAYGYEGGYPHTITFQVDTYDPLYLDINVHAVVYLRKGYAAADVRSAIQTALTDFFAVSNADGTENENVNWGVNMLAADGSSVDEIAWSDVFNAIRDVTGVRKIEEPLGLLLNDDDGDVAIGALYFPRLGTIELINGDTGLPL